MSGMLDSIGSTLASAYDTAAEFGAQALDGIGNWFAGDDAAASADTAAPIAFGGSFPRGGEIGRPAGGLDVFGGSQQLRVEWPVGDSVRGVGELRWLSGALDPQAYGNSLDDAGDAGARPRALFGAEFGPWATALGSVTPRMDFVSSADDSAVGLVGAHLQALPFGASDRLDVDAEWAQPALAGVSGTMPSSAFDTAAAWTHRFSPGLAVKLDGTNRFVPDSGRDTLRLGLSADADLGGDAKARLGYDLIGSSVGSVADAWRWGSRVEGSFTDAMFAGGPLSLFGGAGFGSFPSADDGAHRDQVYGALKLDLDTPSTESFLELHGAADFTGDSLAKATFDTTLGSGFVLGRDPAELTLGGFFESRTDLATGHTRVGAGPALNLNWSPTSEIGIGYDAINNGLRFGVRADF